MLFWHASPYYLQNNTSITIKVANFGEASHTCPDNLSYFQGLPVLFVPFPFVVAILLLVLLLAVARHGDEKPHNWPFLALIFAVAVQSFLSGLRWGYGVEAIKYISPTLAATIPALAYAGVSKLVRVPRQSLARRSGLNAIPAVTILCMTVLWRDAIDPALILLFVGYALAIIFLIRPGTDALQLAPFEGVQPAYRAIMFAAGALLFTATLDGFVFLDFVRARGAYAIPAITAGNLAGLLFLSVAAASASQSQTPAEPKGSEQEVDTSEDREVLTALQAIMEAKRIYRDPDLNLDRLARKTGITARHISSAINRAMTKNVSQYVNEYRISEACILLQKTENSVTEIMFDVGFQTKSNFNREFRRVTDMSPVQWRETHKTPV